MEENNQTTKPKRKLSKKAKGFVRDYVLTGNGTRAIMNNYDIKSDKPEKVASAMAVENLAKPSIQEAIVVEEKTLKKALGDKGISPDKIAEKISVLLEHEDPNAIDKGLKHATAIYGVDDPASKPNGNTYNFIFSAPVQEKIKTINADIKQILIKGNAQKD